MAVGHAGDVAHLQPMSKIVFRTNPSLQIGSGHVMRCLTLADALRAQGAECHFISCAHPCHLTEVMRQRCFKLNSLVATVQKVQAAIKNIATTVPDAPQYKKLMVIDDLADQPRRCDLLLDQNDTGSDYAFAVTSYAFPIQRAIRITKANRVEMFNPEHFSTRSQDLEEAYHDAGQFYWGKARAWQANKVIFGPDSAPVMLPRHRVQDIDTPDDWVRAEWLFKAMSAPTITP